jgi:hypothetical protein
MHSLLKRKTSFEDSKTIEVTDLIANEDEECHEVIVDADNDEPNREEDG